MSETTELLDTPATESRSRKTGGGLSGMVLADLKALAGELGLKGTSGMRKGDLVAAIAARQSGAPAAPPRASASAAPTTNGTVSASNGAAGHAEEAGLPLDLPPTRPRRRAATRPAGAPAQADDQAQLPADLPAATAGTATAGTATEPPRETGRPQSDRSDRTEGDRTDTVRADTVRADTERADSNGADNSADSNSVDTERADGDRAEGDRAEGDRDNDRGDRNRRNRRNRPERTGTTDQPSGQAQQRDNQTQQRDNQTQQRDSQPNREQPNRDQNRDANRQGQGRDDRQGQGQNRDNRQGQVRDDRQSQPRDDRQNRDDDEEGGGRRNRRFRDRNRRGRERFAEPGNGPEPEVRDDDVLVPVAGILDVLDSYAFIRTSGYLTGPNDIYVSLSQVRKNGLRRGDAVKGMVRAPREGEQQRQKFNALVRLDSVNGLDPEEAKSRPEFTKLTPLYPNERLRLETESHLLTTRVIDLVMPVGKGQRALIVSPPKAGKTMVMQAIANAITTNNPECHLMVVLVDERPEEVTDMQRSVKGEVIASTFDRPPADHTMVAELSIERAKRLVEMGRDVVVLLDSITRLGRAYNLAAPASGRILSGGVDSTALFPPKRFLGAARNIENGGSLTIFASALVETGSAGDTVIFEEFKGTGNAELKLDRRLADKRIFPAIDLDQSSTRKEDLLLSPDELAVTVKLRRVLAALDSQQSLELVLDRLRKTRTNIEFLLQVAKTTPGND